MLRFGLIGKSLSHSFSPKYFANKFSKMGLEALYEAIELEQIEAIKEHLKGQWKGLNVTIPYKQTIIPFLDELSPEAKQIGAVNTICFQGNKAIGHNTDLYGFTQSIKPFLESQHERALILGTGGASAAVEVGLQQLGVQTFKVSRSGSGDFSYSELQEEMMTHFKLIVNCSPVGTFPKVEEKPILPYSALGPDHLLYDLVYNPAQTAFLKAGLAQGCQTVNGESMLRLQAEKSFSLWMAE